MTLKARHCVRFAAVLVTALGVVPLGGCIKHVEHLTVAKDGSVKVTVLATGDARDLATGYPVPSGPAWTPEGKDLALWREHVKPGDALHPAPFDESPWLLPDGRTRADVEIGASASFASVKDLPRRYAPDTDPYADAAPAFTTTWSVRQVGRREFYTLERTYHALPGTVRNIWKAVEKKIHPLVDRFTGGEAFTDAEKKTIADALSAAIVEVSDYFMREAIGAHYTLGAATLTVAERERVLVDVRQVLARRAERAQIIAVIDAERARIEQKPAGAASPKGPSPLEAYERDFRSALRSELRAALARTSLDPAEANGILRACELAMARADYADDLDDEEFEVSVTLPGTIVAGNYVRALGAEASFRFKGSDLQDRDITLRAVSLVEPAK